MTLGTEVLSMTDNQKQSLREMRGSGLGYKKIAQALCLPIGTVQSFCRRECVPVMGTAIYDEDHCRQCGKPLVQKDGVKKRKFCSDACRIKWWTEHPCSKNGNTKSSREIVCGYCGKTFTAYGSAPRKYCSHECYAAARFGGDGR
jgi:endogenous inhibitor of DNA gyrase (YacG/DUF329 family)